MGSTLKTESTLSDVRPPRLPDKRSPLRDQRFDELVTAMSAFYASVEHTAVSGKKLGP